MRSPDPAPGRRQLPIALLLAFAVVGGVAACTETRPIQAARYEFAEGQPVEYSDPDLAVRIVVSAKATPSFDCGPGVPQELPDRPGWVFLPIHIEYQAINRSVHVDRSHWALLADHRVSSALALPRCGPSPEMFTAELTGNMSGGGYLVFEVPPSGDLALRFRNGIAPLVGGMLTDNISFEVVLTRD